MVLDIILVLLFICIILYGYKKGAVGIIAKLIAVVLSFALAYLLAETVGEYISQTSFGIKLQTSMTNTISEKLNSKNESYEQSDLQEIMGDSTQSEMTGKITRYLFVGMGFGVVFIATRIIFWVATKILEGIFELPVLRTFNKLGGIIASAIIFVIEVSVILAIIKAISELAFMSAVVKIINDSVITKAMYEHNIVTSLILTKFIK